MQMENAGHDAADALEGDEIADDLLKGTKEIADFLGMTEREAYHLIQKEAIPLKRLPGITTVYSRKSALRRAFSVSQAA